MTAVRLTDVWFSYSRVPVLEGVSLSIEAGERVALLGRNGAGKTTLTKLIVALLQPARGSVRVLGRDTAGKAPEDLADVTAYVFQRSEQQLFARTLLHEVAFGPMQLGASRREAHTRALDALDRVGLRALADEHPYDVEPVQRKLVTLAAAMAQRPRVLIMDEPTQGFDRLGVERVGTVLAGLAEAGVAILAVTHDLQVVAEWFERSVILDQRRVAFDGPSRVVISDAHRLAELGLEAPPAVQLSRALDLPGDPITVREVATILRRRSDSSAPDSSSHTAPM